MIQIPADLLLSIFSLLVTRDKFECMTVCRHWNDIILHHSLFRAIIIDNQKQLNLLIQRVKRDPTVGRKVEKLSLLNRTLDLPVIDALFPNVRQLTIMNTNSHHHGMRPFTSLQRRVWFEYIEKMVECYSDIHTTAILQSGLCKNLTFIAARGQHKEAAHNLIKTLTNAPGLKELHLYQYFMPFQDMELLHETAPLLNSLLLKGAMLDNTSVSSDIKPAPLLKRYRYISSNTAGASQCYEHLNYISQKYTLLEELVLDVQVVDFWSLDNNSLAKAQKRTLSDCVVALGSQLKALAITINEFTDYNMVFNILDQADCKIEKLVLYVRPKDIILNRLAHSTQIQYIRSLTIKIVTIDDKKNTSFKWLKNFTMLKDLSLHSSDNSRTRERLILTLTSILQGLGKSQVETLRLNNIDLVPDDLHIDLVYPSLQKLELFGTNFSTGSDIDISERLPNLKFLKLEDCSKDTDTFTLPNTNLHHLEIVNSKIKWNFFISITTLVNKQQLSYDKNTKRYFVQSCTDDIERDTLDFPLFSTRSYYVRGYVGICNVVCKSLHSFDMFNKSNNWM